MSIRALQRYIRPHYRIAHGRVIRVKGHWWPSDRYFKGINSNRRVKAWLRRLRRRPARK